MTDISTRNASAAASGGHGNRLATILGAVLAGAVLSGVLPLLLLAQVEDVGRSDAWRLTLALMIWAGFRLAVAIANGRPMLFDFFFWLFTYIFMGLAPTVQIRSGVLSRTTPGIDEGLDMSTAMLVWLGVLCYEVGRLVAAMRTKRGRGDDALRLTPAVIPVTAVSRTRALILVAIGVLTSAYFVSRVGVGTLFGSRDIAFEARNAAWPDPAIRAIMYSLAIYPLLVGIGALAQLRRRAARAHAVWYAVLIVTAVALLLTIVNPISSARYSLGTVLFALAIYAGAMITAARVRATLIAAVMGFVFLFPLADAFRLNTVNLARDGFFGEYQGNPDYDAFWQVANAFSYSLDGLVEYGRQALGVVFFWVPRGFWPDKPVDTGILLANYRGYSFDNLSAPLWAEFLVNGGIGFLAVGFLAVGFLLRTMDERLLPAFPRAGFWAIVGAIFPVYMTILLRGSMLQATGAVAVAAACLLIVRSPDRTASAGASATPLTSGMPAPAARRSPASSADRE